LPHSGGRKKLEGRRVRVHNRGRRKGWEAEKRSSEDVTNFIWPYLHQFFDDSHGLKTSLKPLRRPFDQYQSHLEAISNGRDIRQINW